MLPAVAFAIAFAALPIPLPEGAIARLGSHAFRGPSADGAAFSLDGSKVFAPGPEVVYAWNAVTGRRLPDLPCSAGARNDGKTHAVMAGDAVLRANSTLGGNREWEHALHLSDVKDGKERHKLTVKEIVVLRVPEMRNGWAAVSADGRTAAMSTRAPEPGTRVIDLETGRELGHFSPDTIDLSPTGDTLATVHSRSRANIRIHPLKGGRETAIQQEELLHLFRVSDGGKWVVGHTTPTDLGIRNPRPHPFLRVWDVSTGKETGTLELNAHPLDVRFVTPDEVIAYAIRSDDTGVLSRWDVKARKRLWEVGYTAPKRWLRQEQGSGTAESFLPRLVRTVEVAVSADGKWCLVSHGGQSAAVFDATTGKRVGPTDAHDGPVTAVGFSADGNTVWTVGQTDQRTWDAATGELKATVSPTEFRGGCPATEIVGGVLVWTRNSKDGAEVIGWDVAKAKAVWRFTPEMKHVTVTLSADGKRVVLLGGEKPVGAGEFAVYDGPTGKREGTWAFPDRWSGMAAVGLSADGERVWVNGRAKITGYRATDGELPGEKPAQASAFRVDGMAHRPIVSSPDGKTVATTDYNGRVTLTPVVEVGDFRLFAVGKGHHPTATGFSRDGKWLAAYGPDVAKVWVFDLTERDDQTPKEFDAGGVGATAVAFSPDGKRLAVGYADGTAVVWKVK